MRKILVMDDNPLSTFILTEGLGKREYDIIEIDETKDIIKIINDVKPDLIILDIIMPNMSGYDILSKIKNIPVMIVSSLSNEEAIEKAYNLGAKYFFPKPLNIDNLKKVIKQELAYIN